MNASLIHSGECLKYFEPKCIPTTIGSMPHLDVFKATSLIFQYTPEAPAWVQLPKLGENENMINQFSEGMPGIVSRNSKIIFDNLSDDFVRKETEFFENYFAVIEDGNFDKLEYFAISEKMSKGFWEMKRRMGELKSPIMIKGQVTGPVTLGLSVCDADGKGAYYDKRLREIIVKNLVMKSLFEIKHLGQDGNRVMIFLDEPMLLGFGSSAFITISREDVITSVDEVSSSIQKFGALSGVHCEENTDWSILMDTSLNVLSFDAYDHFSSFAIYSSQIHSFLKRGGLLAWGIVPTLSREAVKKESVDSLFNRFVSEIRTLSETGIEFETLLRRSFITPSCGMGGVLDEPLAEKVLELLRGLYNRIRDEYGKLIE